MAPFFLGVDTLLYVGYKGIERTRKPRFYWAFHNIGGYVMIYLSNSFSLQMLAESSIVAVEFIESAPVLASGLMDGTVHNIVGHADTAAVLGGMVGMPGLQANRESVTLQPGDTLYVGQLVGGRLPEGATALPEGFKIQWMEVRIGSMI